MPYEVKDGTLNGESTVVLCDRARDLAAVIVSGVGSNLISLAAPERGIEYLYGPASLSELAAQPTRYGNPVLLPPNRIWKGRFSYAGRIYDFPINKPPHHIHGLVHSLPWRVEGRGADGAAGAWVRTAMIGGEHAGFREVFPQDFALRLTFALRDGVLRLEAEAVNGGPGIFPFGLGYHTYFRLPMVQGEDRACYRLTLPARRRWELEDCFPTGRILPLREEERLEAADVTRLRLDDLYADLSPGRPETAARLWNDATGHGLEFVSDRNFPFWIVWTGPEPGVPFICLEPYSCVTNAPNLDLPAEITGLAALEPGQAWRGAIEFRPF